MDNTVPPEVDELAARTSEFVRDVVIPGSSGGGSMRRARRRRIRRTLQQRPATPALRAAVADEYGGPASTCAARDRLRGGRHQPARPARAQLRRARRGQHAPARARSPRAEQKERYLRPLAAGRGPLLLRDDRAGAGRRLRPGDAAHPRRPARRRLADQRPQVVHHRRRRRGVRDRAWRAPRTTRRPRAARRCSWSTPAHPGLRGRAATSARSTTASSAATASSRFEDCRVARGGGARRGRPRASTTPRCGSARPG